MVVYLWSLRLAALAWLYIACTDGIDRTHVGTALLIALAWKAYRWLRRGMKRQ